MAVYSVSENFWNDNLYHTVKPNIQQPNQEKVARLRLALNYKDLIKLCNKKSDFNVKYRHPIIFGEI